MAKMKRGSKGYLRKTFMYNGKRYEVYARDQKELTEKTAQKLRDLEEGTENRLNPTLNSYYEYFTELRLTEQKGATIRAQKSQFKTMSEVVLNGVKFGSLRLREITRRDIETVRQLLLESGKTPENLNICFAHLNHVFESAVNDDTIEKNHSPETREWFRSLYHSVNQQAYTGTIPSSFGQSGRWNKGCGVPPKPDHSMRRT